MHKQANLIQMVIHLGTHDHPIIEGKCKIVMEQVEFLVQDKVFHSLSTTLLAISLATNKTFLFKHSLNKDGDEPIEPLKGDKLHQVMDKFTILCSPNIQNFVVSYNQRLGNRRYVSNVSSFKANMVMIISTIIVFQDNNLERYFFLECLLMEMGADLIW
jgi:hypothetical protein